MHVLTTSATAAYQSSSAHLLHEHASRSRQALEAVDAYLRLDNTCTTPRLSSFWLPPFLSELAAKFLK